MIFLVGEKMEESRGKQKFGRVRWNCDLKLC